MKTLRELLPDLGRRTLIMGILNATPDSFSDGGRFDTVGAALAHAREMLENGADIVDVGGESTRPGASPVDEAEEMRRVLPVIAGVRRAFSHSVISIDTMKASVVRAALDAGANLVNDVSGGTHDPAMLRTIAETGAPVCLMHLPLAPSAMGWSRAGGTLDENADVVAHIVAFLGEQVARAVAAGVPRANIVIDPGFGFGKTVAQNLEIIRRLPEIKAALGGDPPLLLGTSRKSTLARVIGDPMDRADPGRVAATSATVALAPVYGADIVRVHDAAFMARVVRVADAIARG